jgi:MFS family permease
MSDAPPVPEAATLPPPPGALRWTVLVVISLSMFGNYYVYDCISPMADVLVSQLGFTDSNIGWLQAIYSLPNVFMVLIGGVIIDRIGVKKATTLFGALCLLGSVVTAVSPSLSVMATGRLLFGLGAESLIVAVTTGIAKWFRGRELSFAFGINLTIARLGSFAALNSPTWASGAFASWQGPLVISVVFGLICFGGAVAYWVLENAAQRRYALGMQGGTDKLVWGDLLKFSRSYWFVVALCVTFYSGIFPFQTFAVKFFMDAHGVSREQGGFLSSMLTLFAMIGTPLFGLMVDRVGKRALLMMAGSLLLIPVYLTMAYSHVSLFVPMAVMGVAFSLIPAVMWPSVAYIVPDGKLGTAYGLMTLVQNIGLFGFNVLVGWANDGRVSIDLTDLRLPIQWGLDFAIRASAQNPGGYALGMWIFSSLGLFGFLFAFLLRRREAGPHGHGLENPSGSHPA